MLEEQFTEEKRQDKELDEKLGASLLITCMIGTTVAVMEKCTF